MAKYLVHRHQLLRGGNGQHHTAVHPYRGAPSARPLLPGGLFFFFGLFVMAAVSVMNRVHRELGSVTVTATTLVPWRPTNPNAEYYYYSAAQESPENDDEWNQRRPFPRWNDESGIPLPPLLAFADSVLHQTTSVVYSSVAQMRRERRPSETYFEECLYVVDATGVHASRTLRNRTSLGQRRYRVEPTEKILVLAWQTLWNSSTISTTTSSHDRWSRLREVVVRAAGFSVSGVLWRLQGLLLPQLATAR